MRGLKVRLALSFALAAAWLVACSATPPVTDATLANVTVRLAATVAERTSVAPLGSPFDPGTGAPGITEAELTVSRDGTRLHFDADGNVIAEGGVPLLLTGGNVTLLLPHGDYDFGVDGRDDDDHVLADGHLLGVPIQADTTLAIPLTSFVGDATLLAPHTILPNQVIDVALHVHPPGRTDLLVPTTDYTATYTSSAAILDTSPRGLRLVVECEPITLGVDVSDTRGNPPLTRAATLPVAQICSSYASAIGVDLIPPHVTLDTHPASTSPGTTLTLTGTVNDAQSGVASVDLYDGPVHLATAVIDDGTIPPTYAVPFAPSEERRYDLTLLALDRAGNETRAHTTIGAAYEADRVTGVAIDEGDQSIEVGQAFPFTATVTTTGSASSDLNWSSSDPSIATVDQNGVVAGVATGTSFITASSTVDPTQSDTITMTVVAATPTATRAGGPGGDYGNAVSVLSDGSAIITGDFAGTATFGATTLTSDGGQDVFVARANPDGTWAWAARAGGTSGAYGRAVGALSDGSAVITGVFYGTATFGATTLTSDWGSDVFVAKTNADGTWAWAARAGGTSAAEGFAVGALSDGSAITAGAFDGTATFGATTLTSDGGSDVFVAKTNADGTWAWAARAGGTSTEADRGLSALSDGSAIITGTFVGTATFGATTLTSGGQDVFVAKTNPDGTWAWAARAGGTNGVYGFAVGYAVGALSDGSAITTGAFAGTVTFGATTLTSEGGRDVFVARTNPDGTWAWAARAGGTTAANGRAVGALSDGSAILTGGFHGTATFGATTLTSDGGSDVFVAKTNPDGTWAWAARAGGTTSDYGYAVGVLSDGSAITAGAFAGTATFGATTLTSVGSWDVFVAKIGSDGTW